MCSVVSNGTFLDPGHVKYKGTERKKERKRQSKRKREGKKEVKERQKVPAHLFLVNLCFVALMIPSEGTKMGKVEGVDATLAMLQ